MKIKIEYKTSTNKEVVDLTDFGFPQDKEWVDLSASEQNMVKEGCRQMIKVEIKDVTLVKEK